MYKLFNTTSFRALENMVWKKVLIFMVPKQRFWTVEKTVGNTFCKNFSSLLAQIEHLGVWNVLAKALIHIFLTVKNLRQCLSSSTLQWVRNRTILFLFAIPSILWFRQLVGRVGSMSFSRVWVLDLGYEPSQSTSKTDSQHAVPFSNIFVWGA